MITSAACGLGNLRLARALVRRREAVSPQSCKELRRTYPPLGLATCRARACPPRANAGVRLSGERFESMPLSPEGLTVPKQLSYEELTAILQRNRETVGRRLVMALIEEGLFREVNNNGEVTFFVSQHARPEQLTRIIIDSLIEMLALAYDTEAPQGYLEAP